MERDLCNIVGCKCQQALHYRYKGKTYYRNICLKHHRQKYNMTPITGSRRQREQKKNGVYKLKATPCSKCQWDKSYCHLHRLKPGKDGGKYTQENVIVLCPNCHQIEHFGLLTN